MTVEFVFSLGEQAIICAINAPCTIEGARVMGMGEYSRSSNKSEYFVTYWMNGERKSEWIPGIELMKP